MPWPPGASLAIWRLPSPLLNSRGSFRHGPAPLIAAPGWSFWRGHPALVCSAGPPLVVPFPRPDRSHILASHIHGTHLCAETGVPSPLNIGMLTPYDTARQLQPGLIAHESALHGGERMKVPAPGSPAVSGGAGCLCPPPSCFAGPRRIRPTPSRPADLRTWHSRRAP